MELAREHRTVLHLHILESALQKKFAEEHYPKGLLPFLAELGALSPMTHLVHLVHATERDLELVKEFGCTVVHNPVANAYLGSGRLQSLR